MNLLTLFFVIVCLTKFTYFWSKIFQTFHIMPHPYFSIHIIFQSYILPYLNLSLLVLTLIYLPINLVPYPLVWLYDKILWVTEPALMIAEIVLALNFVMHCGQRVIEKIEEDDSNVWKVNKSVDSLVFKFIKTSYTSQNSLRKRYQIKNYLTLPKIKRQTVKQLYKKHNMKN